MEREPSAWQPFDPGEAEVDVSLSPRSDEDPARILVLLAASDVVAEGWAPRAAVDLARQVAGEDGRTLLADVDLRSPRLHEALGVPNGEGVSDVFLWGASFQRVVQSVEPGLLFAPAGTVVADPAAVARSPRWDAVADGFRQARATLALYLPHHAPGAEDFLQRASDIVVLTGRDGAGAMRSAAWGDRVRAVLGPAEAVAAGAGGTGAGHGVEAPAGRSDGGESDGWEDDVARAVPIAESRGSRPLVWLVLALLVVLLVVVAAWAGWMNVPYLSPLLERSAEVTQPDEQVVRSASELDARTPAPGDEAGASGAGEATQDEAAPQTRAEAPAPAESSESAAPLQRFSLTLAAYPEAGSALERAATLSSRRPDVPFLVVPVEVNGQIFHRLLAGVVDDPAAAELLRASLGDTFGGDAASGWILRDARWTYLLAEVATLPEARARARELGSGGVQPYVLEVSGAPGPVYRVYAGGYADADEASALGAMLVERGLTDARLVQRVGRVPE